MSTVVRFKEKVVESAFAKTLNRRIDAYFRENNISRHANAEMIFKTILSFVFLFFTYYLLMSDGFSGWAFVAIFVLHGFAQLYMTFNISHDANHGAYSSSAKVNRALSLTFDLVGINSYMWRLMHNDAHHAYVNIPGTDAAITSNKLFRFSPYEERVPLHRYQHLYMPFIYCLPTLEWVITKDFYWFAFERNIGNHTNIKHPFSELLILLFSKAFYYTYMLVLPILFLSVSWVWVVTGFVIMHFFIGFTISLIFQPCHITEGTIYPHPDHDGYVDNNYVEHILESTTDYAWKNPIANWFLGCLNVHVIHHMAPGICHVHYPALTKIIHETAAEFGVEHREKKTIWEAWVAHLRFLKALGRADDPFNNKQEVLTT